MEPIWSWRSTASLARTFKAKMRNRLAYSAALFVVIGLGLASRKFSSQLPDLIASYAGDTLWALAAFLGIGILFPRWTTLRVGIAAWLFAVAVEISQLYHAAWIDQIRHTTLGGLILGFGFLWSDIVCYSVGVGLGCVLETIDRRAFHTRQ